MIIAYTETMTVSNKQSIRTQKPRVAVVGAGAAGLFATHRLLQAGMAVSLFEASSKIGKSILATGNGRCNISNAYPAPELYNHPEFAQAALSLCGNGVIDAAFANLGVLFKQEEGGRQYPLNGRADSVVRAFELAFRDALSTGQLSIHTHAKLVRITRDPLCVTLLEGRVQQEESHKGQVRGHAAKKRQAKERMQSMIWEQQSYKHFDAVIVAVGRHIQPSHLPELSFVEQHELLKTVCVQEDDCALALNERMQARVSLVQRSAHEAHCSVDDDADPTLLEQQGKPIWQEQGEVLFKKDALSGIVMFNASRFARPGDTVVLDLLPHEDGVTTERFLEQLSALHPSYTSVELLQGMLPWGLARLVAARVKEGTKDYKALAYLVHNLSFTCAHDEANLPGQVVRGGISCLELDSLSFECTKLPDCYVLGEALDIDGPCGGYNLHWAWASAHACTNKLVEKLTGKSFYE